MIIVTFVIILTIASVSTTYAVDNNRNNSQGNDNTNNLGLTISKILELVNIERTKHNLNALTLDQDLNNAAMVRTNEIIVLFDHKRPDGREITTISSKLQGENIASGQPTAEEVVRAWMNSPTHRVNILNPDFTTLGVGYKYIANDPNPDGTHYWVQLFGGIKQNNPANPSVNNSTVTITLIQVGGLTTSLISSNRITLRWNSQNVANAHGYQIYRYNPKAKTYSHIKTVGGNRVNIFTDKSLTSSSTYTYRVRSYFKIDGKTYYGGFSRDIKVTTKASTPALKLSSKNKRVSISWKRLSRVNGYEIYRSNSKNGKYSLKKTIKSGSTVKFTDTKLKKGTYYYRIRSYSLINKKRIFSDLSSAKAIRVK